MPTLHVTNGDAAAEGLARSGVPGDVLSWKDILHDGAVPGDDDRYAFRSARAAFLADRGWASAVDVVADLARRDARLDAIARDDEIVLWFEPDLFDQLQLIQILARLAVRPSATRPTTSIVPADCFLGPLSPASFVPLLHARRPLHDDDLTIGADAWRAFTASSPLSLLQVADRLDAMVGSVMYGIDSTVALPHLAAALRRQLEEYPDVRSGLSRTERQCCEALAPGPITLSTLFVTSSHASESWSFLGDWSFAWYVQRLSECARPLVEHTNGTSVFAPTPGADARRFWERRVQLTPFGQDAVRDRADIIKANGIDRWIGGVHLTSARHWRWNASAHCLVEHSM